MSNRLSPALLLCAALFAACESSGVPRPALVREPSALGQRSLELAGQGDVAFLPDGSLVLGRGGALVRYEWPSGRPEGTLLETQAALAGRLFASTPDRRRLAISLDQPESVLVIDESGRRLAEAPLEEDGASALALSPAGDRLAIGTARGELWVELRPANAPSIPHLWPRAPSDPAGAIDFAAFAGPDLLVASGRDGPLRGYDAQRRAVVDARRGARPRPRCRARTARGRARRRRRDRAARARGRTPPTPAGTLRPAGSATEGRRALFLAEDVLAFTQPQIVAGVGWQDLEFVALPAGRRARACAWARRALRLDPDGRYLVDCEGRRVLAYDLRLVLAAR